jgi:carbon monoxide dehydrogenase subunit G
MQATSDSAHASKVETVAPRTTLDWSVDAGAFVIAAALGALLLRIAVNDVANRMTAGRVATDVVLGALCCVSWGATPTASCRKR